MIRSILIGLLMTCMTVASNASPNNSVSKAVAPNTAKTMSDADKILSIACASNFKPTLVKLIELYQQESIQATQTTHETQTIETTTEATKAHITDNQAHAASAKESAWSYRISSGSTAQLAIQIQNGAPHHLFFAADLRSQELLLKTGDIMSDTLVPYARGKLAYWEPSNQAQVNMQTLRSSLAEGRRITLANPKLAPYGQAAQKLLKQINSPIGKNKLIIANNAAHSFQLVYQQQLSGGFVPLSLLKSKAINPEEYWLITSLTQEDLVQSVSITQTALSTPAETEAAKLLAFLKTPDAIKLLEDNGYERVTSLQQSSQETVNKPRDDKNNKAGTLDVNP